MSYNEFWSICRGKRLVPPSGFTWNAETGKKLGFKCGGRSQCL